ncbi:MAG TPA: GMC family oxidoreductase [Solirubrobacterales bacterium]
MSTDLDHFDALVLGGGTAGCVVASRLSEDEGRSVCLVEAGPDYGPEAEGRWPREMLDALDIPDSHDWRDRHGRLPVARIIGGCSAHNLCALVLPSPEDYDAWGLPGWGWTELSPYVDRVMEMLPTHRFEDESRNPWFAGLCEAAADLGLPVHRDLNSPDAVEGIGGLPLNVRGTTRWNAAFAYLDQARERPNLTVLAETAVERIELDGDHADSVAVRSPDGDRKLRAETMVLTAGAYGSPAVLLRSGVGAEDELSRHGIEVHLPLPVGDRLREHFGVPLRFAPSEEMAELIGRYAERHTLFPFNGMLKAQTSASAPGRWDLLLSIALFPGPVLSSSVMLMRPEWTGTIRLRSSDPSELPLVTELSLDSDRDVHAAFEGLELGRSLVRAQPLSGLVADELTPGVDATPEDIRRGGRDGLTNFFHPAGTCPMGEGGVTEPDGRLRGTANLYIADASILPEIPPVPTNLTVLAAAEKVTAGIRQGTAG